MDADIKLKINMRKVCSIVMTIAFIVSLSSCAVMFQGTKKRVGIITQTPESKIYVDGIFVGTETASVRLKRKSDHTIIVEKDGCKSQTVPLDREFEWGWLFLYLFVNPLAVITDGPTGAWNGFDKNQVIVPELRCEN
ncbi:MAG: hypothetical protein LBD91_00105 [Prevotellaceae bacterium]|jgi:hypothetical protein|nr:hypothetical protein [Prevotellaceae bacterium]